MIEDELRSMLTDRADDLPDNGARVTQVRSRIGAIRRRRTVGAAVGLVLLAVVGVALTRLPGRPDALPTAVPTIAAPPGPYFTQLGRPSVPGYDIEQTREFDGPASEMILVYPGRIPVRMLVVVRCQQRGTLVGHNTGGDAPSVSVDCTHRVRGGGFEGAVGLEPAVAQRLFAQTRDFDNFRWEPTFAGPWGYGIVGAVSADRLPPWDIREFRPILTGAAGTLTVTIPARPRLDPEEAEVFGFAVTAECVDGVELTLTVPTGRLVTFACDQQHGLRDSTVQGVVTVQDMARLGLRAGDRVPLTVRSTGRQTDQWRLWPLGH